MEKHVLLTLRAMGHQALHFNINDVLPVHPKINRYINAGLRIVSREPERLLETKLLKAVHEQQPDLILVLLGNTLSPKTIDLIRRVFKGKIVCWCQDQITTMGRQYLIGGRYDAIFSKDHYMVEFMREMVGHKAVFYLPEACNPEFHRLVMLSGDDVKLYQSEICTFGTLYYYRQAILEHLCGYDLKVWGNVPDWLIDRIGSKHLGVGVYEKEKCKAISGAKIVLNSLHFGEIQSINCRAFEVAGCAGFQLISFTTAVAEHFEIGKEVEVFRNLTELTDKIDYYLARPEKRLEIGMAGQRRAYAEHTYRQRLSKLIEISACV